MSARPLGRELCVLALCLLACAPGAVAASGGGGAAPRVIELRGTASTLAADGRTVALGMSQAFPRTSSGPEYCLRVAAWTQGKARAYLPQSGTCPGTDHGLFESIEAVAVAGDRFAWVEAGGGNSLSRFLYTARIGDKAAKERASADMPEGGAGGDVAGDLIGGLRGDGDLLAYATWNQCWAEPVGSEDPYGTCEGITAPGDTSVLTIRDQRLWTIPPGTAKRTIATGPVAQDIVGLDAGRIATRLPDGSVAVLRADGSRASTIPVATGALAGTALSGRRFAALRGRTIETYLAHGAGATAGWTLAGNVPLPANARPNARLVDLQGALVVVVDPAAVHVIRLTDGASMAFARAAGSRVVSAAIEPPGVFYATTTGSALKARTTVVFSPIADVRAALRPSG